MRRALKPPSVGRKNLKPSHPTPLLVCPPSATERFLLQPLVCGTVFHHTSVTSLLPPLSLSTFCCRLKSHLFYFLIPLSDSFLICSAWAVTRHLGHCNRYYILTFYIYVLSAPAAPPLLAPGRQKSKYTPGWMICTNVKEDLKSEHHRLTINLH